MRFTSVVNHMRSFDSANFRKRKFAPFRMTWKKIQDKAEILIQDESRFVTV